MMNRNVDGDDGFKVADARSTHDFPLVERCLPALTMLERHGVSDISLMMQFRDVSEAETCIREPRFLCGIRALKKHHDDVLRAYTGVCLAIEDASGAATLDTCSEWADFFAAVRVGQSNQPSGWSTDCEIIAVIDASQPGRFLELS